jgi:predicted helicase
LRGVRLKFVFKGCGDLKKTFGPEDVFHYIYAVFHSPTYRERYTEFLGIDFPRPPLTSNVKLFHSLCGFGARLVDLHLMRKTEKKTPSFSVKDDGEVGKIVYTEPKRGQPGRVWINKTQYFEDVPQEVWDFHVGGYQVSEKWLKDRKGRSLTYEDIQHYRHIVAAIDETIILMAEIDSTIEKHGGWPLK